MLLMIGLFLSVHFLIQLIEETLGDQRDQRDRQHSIVKDGTGLFCLTVPDAEEEQKDHKDDTGSICDQNFRNVHGKPPFAVRG